MHIRNRFATIAVLTALALAAGCRHTVPLPEPSPAAERFAREFIHVLQDSGSAAVLPLTTAKTRALKGFAPNMDVLRGILAASHATMTLAHWNDVPEKDGSPRLIHLVYAVRGAGAPSELEFWIEEDSGHYLLNTIAIGPPNPGGAE